MEEEMRRKGSQTGDEAERGRRGEDEESKME